MKENKKDPKAEVRNRGNVVFPAGSKKVKDDKDHFPINSEAQARNAIARANQYSESPSWYDGSKQELLDKVVSAVKNKYPSIDVSKEAEKPKVNENENISEFAQRMRELAGLAEGNQKKRLKTVEEGESTFDGETVFTAKDLMKENSKIQGFDKTPGDLEGSAEDRGEKFDTHKFEQKTIEEGENDDLYTLNENTIIVVKFSDEEKS